MFCCSLPWSRFCRWVGAKLTSLAPGELRGTQRLSAGSSAVSKGNPRVTPGLSWAETPGSSPERPGLFSPYRYRT